MLYRLIRFLTAAFGLAAIGWSVATLPTFRQAAKIEKLAPHILARESFRSEVLATQEAAIRAAEQQALCRPSALRSAAIIRLRIAEQAVVDRDRSAIDVASQNAEKSIRGALACAPADPFLWFGLFWVTNAGKGFDPQNLVYLRLSYEMGPNEGWIALTRNRLALSLFDSLPVDLKSSAVAEFLAMIKAGLPDHAADIFTSQGAPVRDVLLARIAGLDLAGRTAFADSLRYKGHGDISVPGVEPLPRPPWQQ